MNTVGRSSLDWERRETDMWSPCERRVMHAMAEMVPRDVDHVMVMKTANGVMSTSGYFASSFTSADHARNRMTTSDTGLRQTTPTAMAVQQYRSGLLTVCRRRSGAKLRSRSSSARLQYNG